MRNLVSTSRKSYRVNDDGFSIETVVASPTSPDVVYTAGRQESSPAGSSDHIVVHCVVGGQLSFVASFTSPVPLPPVRRGFAPQITSKSALSLSFLEDGGEGIDGPALCIITRGGDIAMLPVPSETTQMCNDTANISESHVEIVGSVTGGILAAAWSPDEEILVMVVPDEATATSGCDSHFREKVIVMTRNFEVLTERTIRSDDVGEDTPVDVGWGSKSTQFHGSEGKGAATKFSFESSSRGIYTPEDDGLPHISWRGDGNFFFVSSLEPQSVKDTPESECTAWSRLIRTFARSGALSATSDAAVRGLSHTCAARPVGNLVASTQRFGRPQSSVATSTTWSNGRQGRHDVVFFERNGLRHGEFSLYEEEAARPSEHQADSVLSRENALATDEHLVRELSWNVDGSALLVWLSRLRLTEPAETPADVVQVWTASNYHWFLKTEISAPRPYGRFTSVRWHQEQPLLLHLSTRTSIIAHTFHLDHAASPSRWPHDACSIGVLDGPAVQLTPFRIQNVPPPMSAMTLLPTRHLGGSLAVPAHASFVDVPAPSLRRDRDVPKSCTLLALVYPSCLVQVWTLNWGNLTDAIDARQLPTPRLLWEKELFPADSAAAFIPAQVSIVGKRRTDASNEDVLYVTIAVMGYTAMGRNSRELIQDEDRLCFASLSATLAPDTTAANIVAFPVKEVSLGACLARKLAAGKALWTKEAEHLNGYESFRGLFVICSGQGQLTEVTYSISSPLIVQDLPRLPSFTPLIGLLQPLGTDDAIMVCGLSGKGLLSVTSSVQGHQKEALCLARDATSFISTESLLIWTTSAHEVRFLALKSVTSALSNHSGASQDSPDWPVDVESLARQVERGSRIVTCSPSNMSLILQMPRGNLEIIYPRALVLRLVISALDNKRYGFALRRARTHRIDLNVICDHAPKIFLANVPRLLEVVRETDHINLFLSALRDEDVFQTMYKAYELGRDSASVINPEGKTNRICDAVLAELAKLDQDRYISTILTAHVRKIPPDLESGLKVLLDLKARNPNELEEAVKYIIFLADGDALFKAALGMYDFTLALLVAQHAAKQDPREYLPFLRELRALQPPERQRYVIDDHLGRRVKALHWLVKVPGAVEEVVAYIGRHALFREALDAYRNDKDGLLRVHGLYGNHLLASGFSEQAALQYMLAGDWKSALAAFKEAGQWQEVFTVALASPLSKSEVSALVREVADELETDKRCRDAAQVLLDYGNDVERAVDLFCRAGEVSEAKRACALHRRRDLLTTHVEPALAELHSGLMTEIEEMEEQLNKQLDRLEELRNKKDVDPAAFFVENDPALDHIDVMTDTSTQMTQFTRYTAGASSMLTSGSSRQSSTSSSKRGTESVLGWERKRRQREERKKAKGKKGSVYEESYLYDSLQKLARDRLGRVQEDVKRLLPHLIVSVTTTKERSRAQSLQTALGQLEVKALEGVQGLWRSVQDAERETMATLLEDVERGQRVLTTMDLQTFSAARERAARPRLEVASIRWKAMVLEGQGNGKNKQGEGGR